MNTKEADLLTRRPNVKREVDLADALAYNVLNNRYTIEKASSDVVVDSQDLVVSSKACLEVGGVQGS
jgi:hypothetical protein